MVAIFGNAGGQASGGFDGAALKKPERNRVGHSLIVDFGELAIKR